LCVGSPVAWLARGTAGFRRPPPWTQLNCQPPSHRRPHPRRLPQVRKLRPDHGCPQRHRPCRRLRPHRRHQPRYRPLYAPPPLSPKHCRLPRHGDLSGRALRALHASPSRDCRQKKKGSYSSARQSPCGGPTVLVDLCGARSAVALEVVLLSAFQASAVSST